MDQYQYQSAILITVTAVICHQFVVPQMENVAASGSKLLGVGFIPSVHNEKCETKIKVKHCLS
jgi:hypothetical protein